MTRRQKDVVNYFPHDANAASGDTLTVLQSRFGNDGYAFWFKLLEKLCSAEGHYIDCRNSTKWQLLLARTGVNELTGVEIMKLLVEMQAIDKDLWDSKLIWCQNLVDNLSEVYKNRRRAAPPKPIPTGSYCITCGRNLVDMRADAQYCSDNCRQKAHRNNLSVTGKNVEIPFPTDDNPLTTENNSITTLEKPQSRVKYSRVEYSKVILPDFINKELWDDFLEMRKKNKKAPTEKAKELLIKDLEKFRDAGDDPNEVLKQSIKNSWQGLFPLKEFNKNGVYKGNPSQKPGGAFSDLE